MLAEHENKIIGMIYDAALNPVLWQDVLTEVVDFTGSTTAIFTATDQLSPNYDFVFTHNIPPESMRVYQDEQVKILDMRLHAPYWAEKALGDTVLNTFAPYADMPGTDQFIFYEKCAKPTNISHVAAVLLERSVYSWAVFAVHRAPQLNEYSEQESRILKRLGTHMRRALQIYRQMMILQEEKKSIYQVLDRFKLGVMLINQESRLCYTNAIIRKIFEKSSLLGIDKNSSLKTGKEFQEKLNQLIRSALFEASDVYDEAGGVLALYDYKNEASFMLSVLPFSDTQTQYHQKQAIIFVTQTNQPQYLARDYLVQKYKLAKRELEVCDLFVNGLSLEHIAEHMSITYGSVRIYIKNIFAKTECSSQAELMQLLMSVTLEFEHI